MSRGGPVTEFRLPDLQGLWPPVLLPHLLLTCSAVKKWEESGQFEDKRRVEGQEHCQIVMCPPCPPPSFLLERTEEVQQDLLSMWSWWTLYSEGSGWCLWVRLKIDRGKKM